MPTRSDVFEALVSERIYQDQRWGETQSSEQPLDGKPVGFRTLDEFALYVHGYAQDLARIAAHSDSPTEKLDFFRKVGALCVAAMEHHGAPHRPDRHMILDAHDAEECTIGGIVGDTHPWHCRKCRSCGKRVEYPDRWEDCPGPTAEMIG